MKSKSIISIFELTLIILSIVAFAYFVSTDLPDVFEKENSIIQYLARPLIPMVSAIEFPSGCCKETVNGATCQDMLLSDKLLCKTNLIGTRCNTVSECQKGCCYSENSGLCSFNAPKEKCISNGDQWNPDQTCNIPQCKMGCCVIGDNVAMMTTGECSLTAQQYEMEKVFKPLDSKGTCDTYSGSTEMGACLFKSDDYSTKKGCMFTTKAKCLNSGREFKQGYLCTSPELNTSCAKTTKTSCFDGTDGVYFIDSCGNKANIYNSARATDNNYWDTIILPENSCSGSPEICGNCEYSSGSICTRYISGMNVAKPTLGNYVCKNLNCENGKKQGDSWCITDSDNVSQVGYALGTRSYMASCFEGEVRIEGCADFNQEICIENKAEVAGSTEAYCIINDWRSCLGANDFDNYNAIKVECDKLPQCIMFNEIPGNEKYIGLPGFKENVTNGEQGKAGRVGEDSNPYVAQCVPRFTPGYQFWNTVTYLNLEKSKKQIGSNADYGGGKDETDAICSLGTFTCISHIITEAPLSPSKKRYDAENPECNMQAVSQSNQKVSLMMEALNEKCRKLGSCGIQYNTIGEVSGTAGFEVERLYIDEKGKSHPNYTSEGYNVQGNYIQDILSDKQKPLILGSIETLTELTEFSNQGAVFDGYETILPSGELPDGQKVPLTTLASEAMSAISQSAKEGKKEAKEEIRKTAWSHMAAQIPAFFGMSGSAMTGPAASLTDMVFGYLGLYIGKQVGKKMGYSPGKTTALSNVIVEVIKLFTGTANMWIPGYGIYQAFQSGVDHEYYITEFQCKAIYPTSDNKCNVCNEDVRPCSEFKCRSLGENCRYFVENGEIGYCAEYLDIWSAKISPWNEILDPKNKYTNISSSGFKIISNKTGSNEVEAWKTLKFGIVTDEQAICKLDTNHSKKFEDMQYTMVSDRNYETGKVDGIHHWIVVSPHTVIGKSELDKGITTPPMKEGNNEYYIICQNFAGSVNGAPYIVTVKQAEEPDLTPADVVRTSPEDNSLLAYNSTDIPFALFLDEPAECKYSLEYDYNTYEEMPNEFTCITEKERSVYGEWQCITDLANVTPLTKVFVKCKDQPELVETDIHVRNVNRQSFAYEFSICQEGLEINSVEPSGILEVNKSRETILKVSTSGCVNYGEANCAYRMPEFGNTYSSFWDTGDSLHSQPLTDLTAGEKKIDIECVDIAGNSANASINFTVFYDDSAPKIIRAYGEGDRIVIETDEEANCGVSTNETNACDFNITGSTFIKKHAINIADKSKKQTLYIRCEDNKGNSAAGCTEVIKLIDLSKK